MLVTVLVTVLVEVLVGMPGREQVTARVCPHGPGAGRPGTTLGAAPVTDHSERAAVPSNRMETKRRSRQRRIEVAEQRRRQAVRERHRSWLTIGLAVVAGAAVVGAVLVQQALKPPPVAERKLSSFGAKLSAAGCTAVENPPDAGYQQIGPGTTDKKAAAITKGTYASVPPTSGQHLGTGLSLGTSFYDTTDEPSVESAVTSMHHGYSLVWYAPALPAKQVQTLQDIATRASTIQSKFAVLPWQPSYGQLPTGKQVVMTTWGHRQACGTVSGAAVEKFIQQFPPSKAPEPNGT